MFDFDEIETDVQQKGADSWAESAGGGGYVEDNSRRFASLGATLVERLNVLPPISESPWIGTTRRNPAGRIRLFVVLGVGCPAGTYTEWVSPEVAAKYPEIEVVVLELPGHGFNESKPFHDPSTAAREIASVIAGLQFAGQSKGDRRPFALYGFSMGALLLWDVARRIRGGEGEVCSKLYVACRGAPHVYSAGGTEDLVPATLTDVSDFSSRPLEELFDMAMENFRWSVDKVQQDKYDKYMRVLMKSNPKKMVSFVESIFCDNMLAGPGIDTSKEELSLQVECPILFFYSDKDMVWPLKRSMGKPLQTYVSLPETWERYAASSAMYEAKLVAGFGHGDLGSPQSPIFELMMADLSRLVISGEA